jgi:mycothiol synthase
MADVTEFQIRTATMDDVPAAVDVWNRCTIEEEGAPAITDAEMRAMWEQPGHNPQHNTLIFAPDGTPVGYGGVACAPPFVRFWSWGFVHPAYRGQGIGTTLIQRSEQRVRELLHLAPEGTRVTLSRETNRKNSAALALLRASEYGTTRYFWRMVIELDGPPPAPAWPDGIRVRTFEPERDLVPLRHAVAESFQDHYGFVEVPEEQSLMWWRHRIENDPNYDPSVWFLALDGAEIAGMSICLPRMTSDPDMGYVEILGVRRPWRRQGIALALLHHSFGEFYRRGRARVALHVDAQSLTGATRLYEKAGMHADREHEEFTRELRPGVDLSTQAI